MFAGGCAGALGLMEECFAGSGCKALHNVGGRVVLRRAWTESVRLVLRGGELNEFVGSGKSREQRKVQRTGFNGTSAPCPEILFKI